MKENTNGKPAITVGILNYNGLSFLKESIPALLRLQYKPIEIIVFDNGSKDGSIEYLNTIGEINVIKSDFNLGYGEGKNRIVDRATSDYILLIDNDIVLNATNIIEKLFEFYQQKENISFLSVPLIDRGQKTTEHYGLYYSSIKRKLEISKFLNAEPYMPGGFIGGLVFFKKSIFNKLGGYDTIYPFNIDDYDLSARAWLAGYQIYVLPMINVIHIGISTRTNVLSWSWKNQYALSGFTRMMIKNYQFKNVFIWLPIVIIWQLYKSAKATTRFKSLKPIKSFFISFFYLVRDFGNTLEKRSFLQRNRVVRKDIFLNIKPRI